MISKTELDKVVYRSGLSVTEVCEKIGISRAAFYNKRSGKTSFTVDEVEALRAILGITTKADMDRIFFARDVGK